MSWLSLGSFCLAGFYLNNNKCAFIVIILVFPGHFLFFPSYFEVGTWRKKKRNKINNCNVILISPNERANQSEHFNLPQAKLPCTSVMSGLVELFKEAEDF